MNDPLRERIAEALWTHSDGVDGQPWSAVKDDEPDVAACFYRDADAVMAVVEPEIAALRESTNDALTKMQEQIAESTAVIAGERDRALSALANCAKEMTDMLHHHGAMARAAERATFYRDEARAVLAELGSGVIQGDAT